MSAASTGTASTGSVAALRAQDAVWRRPRLALLGTGTVGRAFVARYRRLLRSDATGLPGLALLANSREWRECDNADEAVALLDEVNASARASGSTDFDAEGFGAGDVVVDATASADVAARHAGWLARGIHVVSANKQGNGGALDAARAIVAAQREGAAGYGDAATVGAGLPLIRSIRELVRGGDRIASVEGVLSGSLAWLFHHYDGVRPFSALVREAREAGYTEPDPRIDLSGEDVRRKLLILARAAGLPLEADAVLVESLVPDLLAHAEAARVDDLLPLLDAPLGERHARARRNGARLCFVGGFVVAGDGRIDARVGLRELPAAHPLCAGSGTDNRVSIRSCRYDAQPLVIQGPGAGAEVTAAALLDDVLAIFAAS